MQSEAIDQAIGIMCRRFLNACWAVGWKGSPQHGARIAKVAFRALRAGNFRRAEKLMQATAQTRIIWEAALS